MNNNESECLDKLNVKWTVGHGTHCVSVSCLCICIMHKLGLSCAKLRAYVISRSFKMAAKIPKPVSESDLKPKLTFRISDLNSLNSVYFQKIYDLNIQDGYQTFKMVIKTILVRFG